MATQSRRKSTSVSDGLFDEPFRFSFFQATRLLQGLVRKWQTKGKSNPVGRDLVPQDESVRFSSHLSLQFASSDIAKIHKHEHIVKSDKQDIAEIEVSFLGLTGQSSVLPVYLTELQMQRQREKDYALHNFLDIFNHRAISFFYRAWEKYRLPFSYERVQLHRKNQTDPVTDTFHSLLGIRGDAVQKRLPLNSEDMIFYAGLFATQRRSANALESSLTEYMGVPISINQFKGEWMSLLEDDRCRLPLFPLGGSNNCLGVDTIIGNQVYTMEGKFEIVLGPLKRDQFNALLPNSKQIEALKKYAHMFAGPTQHFSLQYQLEEDAVSQWVLDEETDGQRGLGWNTWLMPKNKKDAQREINVEVHH